MAYLALWPAPHPDVYGEDIDTIVVERAAASTGPWSELASIHATDPYDNWITHYLDETGTATSWYRAHYKQSGTAIGAPSKAHLAELALEITPQDIVDNIQGLPLNFVDARFMQNWIKWAVEAFESDTGLMLSVQTATKEIYDYRVFNKIMGFGGGRRILLRRRPVVEVQAIHYRVRGALGQDILWEGLDTQVEYGSHPDGYNPGAITIYPRNTSVQLIQGSAVLDSRVRNAINVLFTYTHGFAEWPRQVAELIMRYASADVMEVAGQAETAGLASHSIDGFSESFTASATTTTLSAMRMYYKQEIKRLSQKWNKPRMMG